MVSRPRPDLWRLCVVYRSGHAYGIWDPTTNSVGIGHSGRAMGQRVFASDGQCGIMSAPDASEHLDQEIMVCRHKSDEKEVIVHLIFGQGVLRAL